MANWLRSFGTIYHGLQGRWRMGGLNPAVNDDEAVTKAQLDAVGSGFPFEGDALIDGTLNIDFTETLDLMTEKDASVYAGENYFGMAGWVPLNSDGDIMALVLENNDILIYNGVFDMEFDTGGPVLPVISAGKTMEVKTGDYAGTVFSNSVVKNPNGYGSAELAARIKEGADNRAYLFEVIADLVNGDDDNAVMRKTNEAGENVELELNNNETGFVLENTLSDPAASLFDFRDDTGDSILDIRNNGLFVGPNIPTTDPEVLGQIWLDGDTLKVSGGLI